MAAAHAYAVAVASAASMRNTPALGGKAVADIDVASSIAVTEARIAALDEPAVCHKANAVPFIRQIRPDRIVEDMVLDRFDGRW